MMNAVKPPPMIDESLRPLAERELRRVRLGLSFPGPLESRYRQDTTALSAADMRTFALLTLPLYLISIVIAALTFRGLHSIGDIAKHSATVIAVTLLVLPYLRSKVSFRRRMAAFFVLCAAFALLPILFTGTEPHEPPIEELIVCALPISYLLLFSRLALPLGALLACLAIAGYGAVVLYLVPSLTSAVKADLIGLVALQAVPALVALRFLERGTRRLYLHSLLERMNYESAVASNIVLKNLSYTDPLTGVANRRRMEAELARICDQDDAGASFLMLDIDWFKSFNDHYGHPVGDRALQEVANCLSTALRDGDLLGRMGGEEFGVLLPGIVMQEGVMVAERLRAAVAGFPFMVGTKIVPITVSVGLSSIVPHDDPARVVEAADKALYRAKQAGRNRVGGPWLKQTP
ncbi:MAG TPA: GGDEF domain-containing protein [Acidisoma sp.]|uniref:GGDEF domain-containing protein n=1 Tax=Acidisoma sp. TaxID=1872115 RepID=UPI002C057C90|nr:GGDEF domain-containing protein [Acidisoma sp.]HTI01191.1 GGDEF domain-containing protein [Acidisoma sp.]